MVARKPNENIVPRRDISADVTRPLLSSPLPRNVSDLRVENPAETNSRKSSPGNGRLRSAHRLLQVSCENSDTGDTLKTCPDYLRAGMHSRDNDSLVLERGKEREWIPSFLLIRNYFSPVEFIPLREKRVENRIRVANKIHLFVYMFIDVSMSYKYEWKIRLLPA